MPTKKTFTITEAAEKLGISRQAVHLAIKKGALKARAKKVVEVVWIIPAESLEAYSVSALHQTAGKKNNWRLIYQATFEYLNGHDGELPAWTQRGRLPCLLGGFQRRTGEASDSSRADQERF